jgi:hypothetical protein
MQLTNSMELSSSWETASCAATQEFSKILWKPKVHYRVHKSPPLLPILTLINPVHTTPCYLRSILILSSHLRLGLPSGLFPSGFPTKILYQFLFAHACYMLRPSQPPWLGHSDYTWRRVQAMKLLIIRFSLTSWQSLFGSNILLSTLFSNTLNLCSSLKVRDQVSHPYKIKGKIIVLYILIFTFLHSRREDKRQ